METKKYKMYTLYAKIPGSNNEKYTIEESIKNDSKRQYEIFSEKQIEDLDAMTAIYDSIDDLLETCIEERYGQKIRLYEPVIIVDKHITDRSKSYDLYEFVFKEDYQNLKDTKKIREEVREYLFNNPKELEISKDKKEPNRFRGLCNISTNIRKKWPNIGLVPLIDGTLSEYFKEDNYKRYREAYFVLKKIYPEREYNHGVYR